MTSFDITAFASAIAIALVIGVGAVAGLRSQKSTLLGLQALERRMGRLFSVCLFCSAALPTAAMWLVGGLRGAPTVLDAVLIVVLIGLGLVASFTLLGNALKLLADRGEV
jgi:hypothetical protein